MGAVLSLVVAPLVGHRIRRIRRSRRTPGRHADSRPSLAHDLPLRRVAVGVSPTVAALFLAPAAVVLLAPATAYADSAPFTDGQATGGLTLCNTQNKVITSGRTDRPIAVTVVGGSAAVAPYDANGRTAGLFAYQPRRGVDPGDWSGMGMTALSRYTDPKHPMVEILPRDFTLANFVVAYPAHWDGLVQLRVFLRAPNQPTASYTYAATTVKVTDSTWRQLGPQAGAPCNVGRAQSVIRLLGLPTVAPTWKTSDVAGTPTGSAPPPVTTQGS